MTDEIRCSLEVREDDTRRSPGRMVATLIREEERASDRPEIFKEGSVTWPPEGIIINLQHNRQAPVLRAVPFREGRDIKIDAPIPDSTAGRDAAVNVREKVYRGMSVEFRSTSEGRRGGLREIRAAVLGGAALVDSGAYGETSVEVRHQDADALRLRAMKLL